MKGRMLVHLMAAALVSLQLSACGGGGGGGGGFTPISVTVARNPVLKGYSTTVIANFAPYTSAAGIKFGSTVNFSASAGATIPATAVTGPGGVATVKVKSSQAGTYTVAASSGAFAGSAKVSFVDQPVKADVTISLNRTINGFGGIQFQFFHSSQATFNHFSSNIPYLTGFTGTTPLVPGEAETVFWSDYLDLINTPSTGFAKVNITSLTQLYRMNFDIAPPSPGTSTNAGLPAFSIGPAGIFASYTSGANVAPAVTQADFNPLSLKYYDAAGRVLFP